MEWVRRRVESESSQVTTLDSWPGGERRDPALTSQNYATRAPLARWLRDEALRADSDFSEPRVLDVGCSVKPYYPFFARLASEYVGVDLANPTADVRASAESIPLPDNAFELVLCIQLLEHAEDPAAVLRELFRLVRPGGRVLASTHGVAVSHPDPVDHWRWTHTGLERLFRANGAWSSVTVVPGAGTASCLAMLASFYLGVLGRRARLSGGPALWLTRLLNSAGERLDERAGTADWLRPGSLIANYHVTAEAA